MQVVNVATFRSFKNYRENRFEVGQPRGLGFKGFQRA